MNDLVSGSWHVLLKVGSKMGIIQIWPVFKAQVYSVYEIRLKRGVHAMCEACVEG